jgi:hypothetical protein
VTRDGLVTSTMLNLGLMPTPCLAFGKAFGRPEDEEAELKADRHAGWTAPVAAPGGPSMPTRAHEPEFIPSSGSP